MRRAWQVYGCWVMLAGLVGAGWGQYRGIRYDTVIWAAPIEGGILFAVPAAVVGLLPVGIALLVVALRSGQSRG